MGLSNTHWYPLQLNVLLVYCTYQVLCITRMDIHRGKILYDLYIHVCILIYVSPSQLIG